MILPDVIEPGLRVVFCGTAVGTRSAQAGALLRRTGQLVLGHPGRGRAHAPSPSTERVRRTHPLRHRDHRHLQDQLRVRPCRRHWRFRRAPTAGHPRATRAGVDRLQWQEGCGGRPRPPGRIWATARAPRTGARLSCPRPQARRVVSGTCATGTSSPRRSDPSCSSSAVRQFGDDCRKSASGCLADRAGQALRGDDRVPGRLPGAAHTRGGLGPRSAARAHQHAADRTAQHQGQDRPGPEGAAFPSALAQAA